jgi:hypothetical protein
VAKWTQVPINPSITANSPRKLDTIATDLGRNGRVDPLGCRHRNSIVRKNPTGGKTVARRLGGGVEAWVGAVMVTALLWCNAALAAEPKVLLLRGWFGVFSTGLDRIAEELKAKGIKPEVAGHLYWSTAVTEIVRERTAGATAPLVLVGHSQGANNIIDIARSLEAHKIPVTLLVTLAPYMQNPIPGNVVRAINYYQSPGWGAPIAPEPRFHGKIVNINVADWSVSHVNIDKSPKIQAEIVREIAALPELKEREDVAVSHNLPASGTRER